MHVIIWDYVGGPMQVYVCMYLYSRGLGLVGYFSHEENIGLPTNVIQHVKINNLCEENHLVEDAIAC
jgi:hypothetical protein